MRKEWSISIHLSHGIRATSNYFIEQEKENFLRSEANYEEKIQEIQEKLQIALAKNEIENFESLEVLKKD